MSDEFKIDPWSTSNILEEEYERLIKEFGIEEVDDIIRQKFHTNKFLRRKIIFGHRGLADIYKAIETEMREESVKIFIELSERALTYSRF